MAKYEVFISFKNTDNGKETKDARLASELYDALCKKGIKTFFSKESVMMEGTGNYRALIDLALDECTILVAVGTKAEYLDSKWVKYEYVTFHDDILSGIKDENICTVCSYVVGVSASELPRPLRTLQCFDSLDATVDFVLNNLKKSESVDDSQVVSSNELVENNEALGREKKAPKPKKEKKQKPAKQKKTKNTKKILLIILAIIVLIVGACVGYSALNKVRVPVVVDNEIVTEAFAKKDSYIYFSDCTLNDDSMAKLSAIKKLNNISFVNCEFENDCYQMLPECGNIEHIRLDGCKGITNISFMQDMSQLSDITIINCGLNDEMLESVSFCNCINRLDINTNDGVTRLDFIKNNDFSELTYIDFSNTAVSDVEPLSTLPIIDTIFADNCNVSDINCLSKLSTLDIISFENNKITNVSEKFNSLEMTSIKLAGNKLNNLAGLNDLTQLRTISLEGGFFHYDFVVKSAKKLTNLTIINSIMKTDDFDFLLEATELDELVLSGNNITNLDFLENCTKLTELTAVGCGIEDVGGIAKCTGLTNVNLSSNKITDISAIKITDVNNVTLDFSDNDIVDVAIPKSEEYYAIYLYNNKNLNFDSISGIGGSEIGVSYTDKLSAKVMAGFFQANIIDVPNDRIVDLKGEFVDLGVVVKINDDVNNNEN